MDSSPIRLSVFACERGLMLFCKELVCLLALLGFEVRLGCSAFLRTHGILYDFLDTMMRQEGYPIGWCC